MEEPHIIREAMGRKGLIYRDLAFLTGLDHGYLNRVARGEKLPSREAALRIAKALGLQPEDVPARELGEAVG